MKSVELERKHIYSDWPDSVVAVATHITDAQVVHHHQHKVGPSDGRVLAAITPHQQQQTGNMVHTHKGP